MMIVIRQLGWVGCALAFLALCPDSNRDWFCVWVLCALQCAKNCVGQHGKVLGLVKQERCIPVG
jgi:hypothetical protein